MKHLILLLLLIASLTADEQIDHNIELEKIKKDFSTGKTDEYHKDNYPFLNKEALVENKIYGSASKPPSFEDDMSKDECISVFKSKVNLLEAFECPTLNTGYLSSIAKIDSNTFTLKCAIVEGKEKRIPIGFFNYSYPGCAAALRIDKNDVKKETYIQEHIKKSEIAYKQLFAAKKVIEDSVGYDTENEYLNSIDVLVAVLTTNSDIIDIENTQFQGKIVLNAGYTSRYTDSFGEVHNSVDIFENVLNSVFQIYLRLVNDAMMYFLGIVTIIGMWGFGGFISRGIFHKFESTQNGESKGMYLSTLILGLLFVVPISEKDFVVTNSMNQANEYSLMHSSIQNFEKPLWRKGLEWANSTAKTIIDVELDTLILNAGFTNADEIINGARNLDELENKFGLYSNLTKQCTLIYNQEKVKEYSDNQNRIFPISEKYALLKNIYLTDNNPIQFYQKSGLLNEDLPEVNMMPPALISACGAFESSKNYFAMQHDEQLKAYNRRIKHQKNDESVEDKLRIIEGLITYQYQLFRDFGFASIVALPLIKMRVNSLDSTPKNDLKEQINRQIKEDSWGAHMIISSLPYAFLPGMNTVFNIAKANSGELGAVTGLAGGISSMFGPIAATAGYITGKIASGAVALTVMYQVAIAMLSILPLISIVGIGIARLTIIIAKIFVYHFATIFLLPVIFLKDNTRMLGSFASKLILLMLELPVFVLSIWMAIVFHQILLSMGNFLAKNVSLVLLKTNNLFEGSWFEKIKLYLFDGFIEVTISVLSIVLIYKLIVTMHTAIFELLDAKGGTTLDGVVDSMQQGASSYGSKL